MQTAIYFLCLDVAEHELQIRKCNIRQVKRKSSIHQKLNAELQ